MADRSRTTLDWEDVRFFAALARHGSLSATARALSVNHATVSRRVAGLERSLGAPLFERRPTGYALTDAGRIALEAAGAMEAAAEALPRLDPRRPLAGLVRLTATPSLAESFLIPRLGPFRAAHPALDIELIADRRSVSLARREADIALRLARPEEGDLTARRVATVSFGFYAAPSWRDRLAQGGLPAFVGFDEGSAHLPEAVWFARRFPGLRLAFRANSQTAQAAAARAGCGVALLPHFLGAADPGLVLLPWSELPPPRELWLLSRRDAGSMPPIRAVKDFLVALFERERSLFEGP
jgi:DNA-binding transcriptional LysR family regulator